MKIVVIDYGSGNLASASRAVALAADLEGIVGEVTVTADPRIVAEADRIILPGQGAFADCALGLARRPGLRETMFARVDGGVPFFGICVGMQLMAERGLEFEPGSHPLLDGLEPDDHVYFVHSYALTGGDPAECIATTDYGGKVVAMVAKDNRAGTQFHVEKSQAVGIRILRNFLRWKP